MSWLHAHFRFDGFPIQEPIVSTTNHVNPGQTPQKQPPLAPGLPQPAPPEHVPPEPAPVPRPDPTDPTPGPRTPDIPVVDPPHQPAVPEPRMRQAA